MMVELSPQLWKTKISPDISIESKITRLRLHCFRCMWLYWWQCKNEFLIAYCCQNSLKIPTLNPAIALWYITVGLQICSDIDPSTWISWRDRTHGPVTYGHELVVPNTIFLYAVMKIMWSSTYLQCFLLLFRWANYGPTFLNDHLLVFIVSDRAEIKNSGLLILIQGFTITVLSFEKLFLD